MHDRTLRVHLARNPYDILIGRGLLDRAGPCLREALPSARALILTDDHVAPLYAARLESTLAQAGYQTARLTLKAGEQTKSLASLPAIYAALSQLGITRSDALIALGGGVIGDLGGFAAATYLRGILYAQIPTTMLAQVDSSVGGKTAVDLPEGKNLVGCFYQPARVIIDPDTLFTLPERVYADGMGEVIKYAAAFEEDLLALLAPDILRERVDEVIYRCLDIKRRLVETDERDTGERMLLNFGHTLGHAIEAAQHYSGMTHGEAVAAGMCLITRLTESKGMTPPGVAQAIEQIAAQWRLPSTAPAALWPAMRAHFVHDKKNLHQSLHAIVLGALGHAAIERVDANFFEEVTQWLT